MKTEETMKIQLNVPAARYKRVKKELEEPGIEISLDYLKDKEALDSIRNSGDFGEQIQNISEVHDSIELEWKH